MVNIILCTLGNRIDEIIRNLDSLTKQKIKLRVIIVTQDNHKIIENLIKLYNYEIVHICDNGKGLSRARNIAMQYVNDGFVLFADDDNWYGNNLIEEVIDIMSKQNIMIGCFKYYDPNLKCFPKNYKQKYIKSLSYLKLLKVSSIEIVINLNLVNKNDIIFNENFGVGTSTPSGEENLMLTNLKKKKYIISYFPIVLSYHPYKQYNSNVFDESFFNEKKRLFKELYNPFIGYILFLSFKIKKGLFK